MMNVIDSIPHHLFNSVSMSMRIDRVQELIPRHKRMLHKRTLHILVGSRNLRHVQLRDFFSITFGCNGKLGIA